MINTCKHLQTCAKILLIGQCASRVLFTPGANAASERQYHLECCKAIHSHKKNHLPVITGRWLVFIYSQLLFGWAVRGFALAGGLAAGTSDLVSHRGIGFDIFHAVVIHNTEISTSE